MSELRTLMAAGLLAGGVAAAVSAVTVRMATDSAPRIASVRLGELAADYATQAARTDASPEATASAVRAWAHRLEDALAQVAARHRVVLLPARAVAAGAHDLTAEVEAVLAKTAGRSDPATVEPEARP